MVSLLLLCAAAAPPNVLFITVDTLRADRLGCYGYALPISPNIDALAAKSLVFDNMIVEEPQTGPSMIAMFTGLPPRTTGTIRNAVPVSDDVPTFVQQFAEAGYATGAVVSNWNLKSRLSNIARGFSDYEDDFGRNLFGIARKERDAKDVTNIALDWFRDRDSSTPFFYWAHYMDPHSPYHFHGRFNVHEKPPRELGNDDALNARYDSEVAYADHHIGRLLDAVPRENTWIVFTADHGESLMDHGYLGHTREIYQTTMHVPLVVYGPAIEPGRSAAPLRGTDIGALLAGLGRNVVAEDPPAGRVRVFETYDGNVPEGDDVREALADRPPSRQAAIAGHWKLILRDGRELLFDLAADPGELTDISGDHPGTVARLRGLIDAWVAETPRNVSAGADLSDADREALEALGYVE